MTQEFSVPGQFSKSQIAPKAPMSVVESTIIDQTKAERRADLADNETVDSHQADLAGLVMDHWDQIAGRATCFGVPVDESMVPDKVVACLIQIETNYEMDLAVSLSNGDFSVEEIGALLRDELVHSGNEESFDYVLEEVEKKREALSSYAAQVTEWKSDPEWQAKSNLAKVADILAHPDVPEGEKAKWRQFQAILTIASVNETDNAIVTASFEQVDVFSAPSAESFARGFIFDGPDGQAKTGVSEATQNAIAGQLGIVRHTYASKTGSDVNDIYKKGIGRKTVRDPDTGELREETVYLQPGENVEIRKGHYIGLSDTNRPVMRIVGEHTYTSNLPEKPTDHDMTMYGIATQWIAKLNDVNMAEIFFPHSMMERGGGHIKLNMPVDFNRAQKLSQIFFGSMAGYNGELLDQSNLDRIPYLMQFQNEKGDAVIGDVDPNQMRADYKRQGVLNKEGKVNWDRFGQMVEANRNGLFFGEKNYGHSAKDQAA